ncbi:MAG: hypothetical protein ACLQDI_22620, partial [Syntrophobacteraceae bacterium]
VAPPSTAAFCAMQRRKPNIRFARSCLFRGTIASDARTAGKQVKNWALCCTVHIFKIRLMAIMTIDVIAGKQLMTRWTAPLAIGK